MRTVITISLNGNAYQLDAVGFDALRAYLQVAEQRLAGNPDQEEILADLEQAIADKCNRYLGPHKNVVSASELTAVLREMGPVDGGAGEAAAHGQGSAAAGGSAGIGGAGGPGSLQGSGGLQGPDRVAGVAGAGGANGTAGAAGGPNGSGAGGAGGAWDGSGGAGGAGGSWDGPGGAGGAGGGWDGPGGAGDAGGGWDRPGGAGGGLGGPAGADGPGGFGATSASLGAGSTGDQRGEAGPGVSGAGPGSFGSAGGMATGMGMGSATGAGAAAGVGGTTGAAGAGGTGSAAGMGSPGGATAGGFASGAGATVRRLYLIREGAYIAGVCKGLAAYLNLDISIVRLLFIVLTVLTGGAWILVYIVMMFVVPYAETSEQHAAAHGWPFNAEEVIARAKAYYAEFTSSEKWRRQQWRQQRRMWRSQNKTWQEQRRAWERAGGVAGGPPPPPPWSAAPPTNMSYSSQVMSGVLTPLVELIGALLFVGFLFALVSLATHHRLFGWTLPGDVPGWVAILVLIVIYRAVVSPLRQARFAAYYGTPFGAGWLVLCGVLLWLVLLSWFGWWAWQHWDQILTIFQQITTTLRNLIDHEQAMTARPAQAALQWLPGAPSCLLWGCGKLEAHG